MHTKNIIAHRPTHGGCYHIPRLDHAGLISQCRPGTQAHALKERVLWWPGSEGWDHSLLGCVRPGGEVRERWAVRYHITDNLNHLHLAPAAGRPFVLRTFQWTVDTGADTGARAVTNFRLIHDEISIAPALSLGKDLARVRPRSCPRVDR